MKTVYLGLGSNLENREQNLLSAIDELKKLFQVSKISSIYETAPYGYEDQADFLNMCIKMEVDIPASELLSALQNIESNLGREKTFHWGPRIIDLDILLFENETFATTGLTIPHPEMQQRRFVMEPLAEIAGEVVHPILQKTLEEINSTISNQAIKKYERINN